MKLFLSAVTLVALVKTSTAQCTPCATELTNYITAATSAQAAIDACGSELTCIIEASASLTTSCQGFLTCATGASNAECDGIASGLNNCEFSSSGGGSDTGGSGDGPISLPENCCDTQSAPLTLALTNQDINAYSAACPAYWSCLSTSTEANCQTYAQLLSVAGVDQTSFCNPTNDGGNSGGGNSGGGSSGDSACGDTSDVPPPPCCTSETYVLMTCLDNNQQDLCPCESNFTSAFACVDSNTACKDSWGTANYDAINCLAQATISGCNGGDGSPAATLGASALATAILAFCLLN